MSMPENKKKYCVNIEMPSRNRSRHSARRKKSKSVKRQSVKRQSVKRQSVKRQSVTRQSLKRRSAHRNVLLRGGFSEVVTENFNKVRERLLELNPTTRLLADTEDINIPDDQSMKDFTTQLYEEISREKEARILEKSVKELESLNTETTGLISLAREKLTENASQQTLVDYINRVRDKTREIRPTREYFSGEEAELQAEKTKLRTDLDILFKTNKTFIQEGKPILGDAKLIKDAEDILIEDVTISNVTDVLTRIEKLNKTISEIVEPYRHLYPPPPPPRTNFPIPAWPIIVQQPQPQPQVSKQVQQAVTQSGHSYQELIAAGLLGLGLGRLGAQKYQKSKHHKQHEKHGHVAEN